MNGNKHSDWYEAIQRNNRYQVEEIFNSLSSENQKIFINEEFDFG